MYVLRHIPSNRYFWHLKTFGVDMPSRVGLLHYDIGRIPIDTDFLREAKKWKTLRGAENYIVILGIHAHEYCVLEIANDS